jgi:hypothetical protein
MARRLLVRSLVGAGMIVALAVAAAPARAAATALVLPQGTAFAILGHSCGGIQEKVYATGFDPASGYPTGVVLMSTRCGGSGRGGGYHVTTYSASAGVTWDFVGTVVSYVVPALAVTVDPGLVAYDAHGNEVYNQSDSAFLVLAAGFVPVARVTAVAPATGPATGGTTVTITGTGFTGATGVGFGPVAAASFTVTSSTSITAVSPAAAAGTVDVTVLNAGGASGTSAADQFTFAAAPTVTGVSPGTGSPAGGTAVTITGTHLGGATRVAFGGTSAGFEVESDTSITAYAPAAEAAGTVDVRVTTAGGTSARTSADRFAYVVTRPVVTAVAPTSGPQDGGTEVTITGSHLSGATDVEFGRAAAVFWVNDDTSITAYSPTAGAAGTVDVTVASYETRSATSAADRFTYLPAPAVTGVGPATGPAAGGTSVTVTGTGFAGASEVDFGGVPASFTVAGDSSLTAVSPPGTAGTVDVTVTSDGGTSPAGAGDEFTYVDAPPLVTGVSPGTGSEDGGTLVVISGASLANTVEVDFGGVSAPFGVIDDTSVLALSPAGTGAVDVTVTTDAGTSAASAGDLFTYVPAPVVTGVTPAGGPSAGGTVVTIAGTNLAGAVEVDFGANAAEFTVDADGSITAVAPPGTAGTVDVTVTTDGGASAASAADQFTYT